AGGVVPPDLVWVYRLESLRRGRFGRCVYRCDNDVVDHPAAILWFANRVVASLSVTAFTTANTRTLRILGAAGELKGHLDRGEIHVRAVRPGVAETPAGDGGREEIRVPVAAGHGGGGSDRASS